MKKRIISFLLAIVLVATLVPSFMIGASAFSFADFKNIFGVKAPSVGESVKESVTTFGSILKDLIPGLLHGKVPVNIYDVNVSIAKNSKAGLSGDIVVKINENTKSGTIYLPGSADAEKLALSWDADLTVTVDGKEVESGSAKIPAPGTSLVYSVDNGEAVTSITIKTLQGSKDVSAMFLNIDESLGSIADMNADEAHETKCFGSASLDGENYKYISMKGRGNSTWSLAKKPYNVTFYKKPDEKKGVEIYSKKDKVELIEGTKAKQWSLLANFMDNSLLRNKVGLDLANVLGIGLDTKYVDLYMNGEYLGNYLLTPKSDYQSPDNGYVLENDNYKEPEGGDPQFKLNGMYELGDSVSGTGLFDGYYNRMTVKDIGDDAALAGVTNESIAAYVNEAWAAVLNYNSEDYQKYFDLDSWSKMYLMYEVGKTYDAFAGSILMHRDGLTENDKIIAGPAWDMDTYMGRTMYKFFSGVSLPTQVTAEGWYIDGISVIGANGKPCSLLQELGKHQSFRDNVAKIYNENKAAFEGIVDNIKYQADIIENSANMDADVWGLHHLGTYYYFADMALGTGKYQLNYKMTTTWRDYVDNMTEFTSKRVMWLSDNLTLGSTTLGSSKLKQTGQMVKNVIESVNAAEKATTVAPVEEETTTANVTEEVKTVTGNDKATEIVSTVFSILGKILSK